jgi:hypothetical protein
VEFVSCSDTNNDFVLDSFENVCLQSLLLVEWKNGEDWVKSPIISDLNIIVLQANQLRYASAKSPP